MRSIRFKKEKKFSRSIRISKQPPLVAGVTKIKKYTEYLLPSAVAAGVLITLFVTFTGGSKPPVNPFREGQNVLLPPEGNISLSVNKFPY